MYAKMVPMTTAPRFYTTVLADHFARHRQIALVSGPRQAEVVELCHFGGLIYPEIGRMLGISEATVDRDLRHARAWLRREMLTATPGA